MQTNWFCPWETDKSFVIIFAFAQTEITNIFQFVETAVITFCPQISSKHWVTSNTVPHIGVGALTRISHGNQFSLPVNLEIYWRHRGKPCWCNGALLHTCRRRRYTLFINRCKSSNAIGDKEGMVDWYVLIVSPPSCWTFRPSVYWL